MDSGGDILLRQPQHLQELVGLLTEENFAKQFGDLRLVFSDGVISFYKVLLAAGNREWGRILGDSQEADLVIMEGVKRSEFVGQVSLNDVKVEWEDDLALEDTLSHRVDKDTPTNIIISKHEVDAVDNSFSYDEIKVDLDYEANQGDRLLSQIKSDFHWPSHHYISTVVKFPNFHSIGWGSNSGLVFEVMGNRSIFTVISEKQVNLPHTTPFTVINREEDLVCEKSGILSLKDFLNGGASNSLKVFQLEGSEEKLNLFKVLDCCGYKDKNNVYQDAKNIKVGIDEAGTANLKECLDTWKSYLIEDTIGHELLGGSKFDKNVTDWLRKQASTTLDGGVVCVYCGMVCYDQSTKPWHLHVRRHLYRMKKCKVCSQRFLAGDNHASCSKETSSKTEETSSIKKEIKKFSCSECDLDFVQKANLKRHLLTKHNIVDKIVFMRECGFCLKSVSDLSFHILEFHKNETISCDFCDKTFSNPAKHRTHVNITHKKVYAGFCEICQKEVTHMAKHNAYYHLQRSWPCDHCDKVFKLKSTLRDHMQSVEGTREKKPCPECGKLYINVYDHIRRFHKGYRRKLKDRKRCGGCDKHVDPAEFEEHKLVCKRQETICHICSKTVVMIEQHLAKVHQVTDIQCSQCGGNFLNNAELNKHIRIDHFPKMISEAGFCENDIFTEDVFKRETIATKFVDLYSVLKESRMQCNLCNITTADSRIKMTVHMKDHLGYNWKKGKQVNNEPERMCPQCGLMVKQLASHQASCRKMTEKLVVTRDNEQTHSCTECGLMGLTVDTYVQHMLRGCKVDREMIVELELEVNTSDKVEKTKKKKTKGARKSKLKTGSTDIQHDFKCSLCQSSFRIRPYLNRHMKRVHKGKLVRS